MIIPSISDDQQNCDLWQRSLYNIFILILGFRTVTTLTIMGRPVEGSPLSWAETEEAAPIIRKWATEQLLCLWHKQKNRSDPTPLWGDEIEYALVNFDSENSKATLLLDQERVIRQWETRKCSSDDAATLQWEWATYVVETTPAEPYSGRVSDLLEVEANMRERRKLINRYLSPHQQAMSLCSFPRIGVTETWTTPGPTSGLVCPLPRYRLLAKNVHSRPQGRMRTYFPIYRDHLTSDPFHDHPPSGKGILDHLCIDELEIGTGCCSIQTTFQAANESEARWLYDQLIPLGHVLLAMTAATPIWKGYLVETDIRWQRFGDLVDDRRPSEMDFVPPRWTWNRTYLSREKPAMLGGNMSLQPMDKGIKNRLLEGGMDDALAEHFASILARDPLLLTRADLEHLNNSSTRLFELLHGCVWHHIRFKPPLTDSGPGWCVEFRPMEVQLTDFENAAFAIFMYLLSRAITTLHLNFYLPLDMVGESWDVAQKRNAVLEGRFWFRRTGWSSNSHQNPSFAKSLCKDDAHLCDQDPEYGFMTVDEIINGEGTPGDFPGLLALVRYYLDYTNVPPVEQARIAPYLDLIQQRASGISPTPASWMREFVHQHGDYHRDSYVSEKVCYDMMEEIARLNKK
ncbi:Glutamate-cysteine ligase catalytic subunit [Penicillium canariense]|uniref:Glutamate--cysteine ligase n=1 Tax=Penicillium canariense TaxID=189055 RepID=A0A9W9LK66_9EURO|nr:Glutamate-cysteine ligase catalytic subunit [Penicillium canariense]KAJ5160519.1 Glutamate-cysteine ligase catalytic subunit [Penicillium canariense]